LTLAILAFIFAALLEYALVNYYGRREYMHQEKGGGKKQSAGMRWTTGAPRLSLLPAVRLLPSFFSQSFTIKIFFEN
jgi:hypothetical protein